MIPVKLQVLSRSSGFCKLEIALRYLTTAINNSCTPEQLRTQWSDSFFNIEKMTELLDHDNHKMRKDFRKFLSDPLFTPRYNISLVEEREVCFC